MLAVSKSFPSTGSIQICDFCTAFGHDTAQEQMNHALCLEWDLSFSLPWEMYQTLSVTAVLYDLFFFKATNV